MHEAILRQDQGLELIVPDAAWTRRETAERVGDEAGQAAARRGELRRLEAGLASDVADLTELHDRRAALVGAPAGGDSMPICPFQGLAASRRTTPTSSSGASAWSPNSWRGSSGHRCWASSDRRGAASPRSCGRGCCRRSRTGPAGQRALGDMSLMRPGETRWPRSSRRLAGASDRRVVVDQFEELFTAAATRRAAAFVDALVAARAATARPAPSCSPSAPTSTAAARRTRARRAARREPGPRRPDDAATSCGARSSARRARGPAVEPELVDALVADVAGRARRAAAALDRAAGAVAAPRRPGGCGRRLRAHRRRARRGRPAGRGGLRQPERASARRRAAILLRLAGAGEGDAASCAAASRSTSSTSATTSRPPRARRPGRQRLVTVDEGDGRGRARGAAARVAAAARLARGGRRGAPPAPAPDHAAARDWDAGGRDPGELYRGARLARRWTGPPATATSSTGSSASSWRRAAAASRRPSAAAGRTAAFARCSPAGRRGALVVALAAGRWRSRSAAMLATPRSSPTPSGSAPRR